MSNIPWTNKYRPIYLDDIVGQDHVIYLLKCILRNKNLPHLILHGSSGTGKTTAIIAMSNSLFGKSIVNDRVKVFNASDERGISMVRNKIVSFVKMAVAYKDNVPLYKLIILEESDTMTMESQYVLRKVMEDYSHLTRFCFVCNYVNQITPPIASRCIKIKFNKLNNDNISKYVLEIAKKENIHNYINDNIIQSICKLADGDMRVAIMSLYNLKYMVNTRSKQLFMNIITNTYIDKIYYELKHNTLDNSKISLILSTTIVNHGHVIKNVIKLLIHKLIYDDVVDDVVKVNVSRKVGNIYPKLYDRSNEYVQLMYVLMLIRCQIYT
jgi:replication factor C subunit 2/4